MAAAPIDAENPFRYSAALAADIEMRWQDEWDANGTFEAPNPAGPLADPVRAVVFSRDYAALAAAAGKVVKVWNAADGKELATLTHPAAVTSLSLAGFSTVSR